MPETFARHIRCSCLWITAILVILTACQPGPAPATPTATLPPAPTQALTSTPEPTTLPPTPAPTALVVCLGEEPPSLYVNNGYASTAQWNILEAIYDGPIDRLGYQPAPVILEKIPSLADGDAVIESVEVKAGDQVVDADGNLAALAGGTRVRPAGCHSADCAVTWDGQSALSMDQLRLTFKLKPGILWSDGQPLRALDSVYSYNLAADPGTPVSKYLVDRIASYRALDELTAEWLGKPGFLDDRAFTNFWLPLPEHAWGGYNASELLQAARSAVSPIGWGPYIIEEWTRGDHITLRKNPAYFRRAEGLPRYDNLVFRFISGGAQAGLDALQAGECDILDRSIHLEDQLTGALALESESELTLAVTSGPEWEQLVFGIRPAAYDDGLDLDAGERPDLFADVRTRQAFAYCLDRQGVVDQLLGGLSQAPDTYLSTDHPLFNPGVTHYTFDPTAGSRLLDEVGWKDDDNNPATARLAQGVAGVPAGTPLAINLWITEAPLRQQAARLLVQSLAQCGIQANLQAFSPEELFAGGEQGMMFGRRFDLVELAWDGGTQPQCFLFDSRSIPQPSNRWIGVNVGGYTNPEFDLACQTALNAPASLPESAAAHAEAQAIYAGSLPSIPIFLLLKIAAFRPEVCAAPLDPSARSDLWALESLRPGPDCQP